MKEKQYKRGRREPLGKTMERNYLFPPETQSDGFKFGVPTRGSKQHFIFPNFYFKKNFFKEN